MGNPTSSSRVERPVRSSRKDVEESRWFKFLPVPGLLLNTIVSAFILAGLDHNWSIRGSSYRAINDSRATTQIVVQIVAGLLGGIYVQTVCKLINFSSRIALIRRPMSLDRLKLWYALSVPNMDWSTPMTTLPLVMIISLMALIPSALWAGALTPIQSSSSYTLDASVNLPRYTENTYSLWSQNFFNNTNNNTVNPKGTFSYLPIQDRFGFLITDGSAASSVDGRPQQHTKNDNSNYTFIGRSYGVASSVGLTDDKTQQSSGTISYRYVETGYNSSVECIHNVTSQFSLQLVQDGFFAPFWETPFLYLATGPGPNTTRSQACASGNLTQCGGFITAGLGGVDSVAAAAWWASFESGNAGHGLPRAYNYLNKPARPPLSKAYTSLASGASHANLNNTQCSITMVPASFSIEVNTLARTIKVTPQPDAQNVIDIEPSGFIADSASSVLGTISSVDTTLYTSVLGTMLQRNIENVAQQHNQSTTGEQNTVQGVAESLQALIDDYLLATASAQLMVAQDFAPTTATITRVAFNIGQRGYAVSIVIINAIVVVLFAAEAIRTRHWKDLTRFNFADVKSVVVASSLGGRGVGVTASATHHGRASSYVGDSGDHHAGAVKVLLRPYAGMTLGLASEPSGEATGDSHSEDRTGQEAGAPLMDYPATSEGSEQQLIPPVAPGPLGKHDPQDSRGS